MLSVSGRWVQGHRGLPVGGGAYGWGFAEGTYVWAQEGADRRAALKPCEKRWHLIESVLGQYCDQFVNVGVLDGGHVPVAWFTLALLRWLCQRVGVCG